MESELGSMRQRRDGGSSSGRAVGVRERGGTERTREFEIDFRVFFL